MLARHDIVLVGGTGATIWTETGKIEWTQSSVLDVTKTAIRTQSTEASGIVRTRSNAQRGCGGDVKICALDGVSAYIEIDRWQIQHTLFALRTDAKTTILLALPLAS